MTERPSPGEQVAGIGGLVLFLTMFLFAWYGLDVPAGVDVNGFDAFDAFGDWFNIILVLAAFAGMELAVFGSGSERLPISLSVFATVLGGIGDDHPGHLHHQPAGLPRLRRNQAGIGPQPGIRPLARPGLADRADDRRLHDDAGGGCLLRRRGGPALRSDRRTSPRSSRRRLHRRRPSNRHPTPRSNSRRHPRSNSRRHPRSRPLRRGSNSRRPPDRAGRSNGGSLRDSGRHLLGEGDHGHHRVDPHRRGKERRVGDVEALDAADRSALVADPGPFLG